MRQIVAWMVAVAVLVLPSWAQAESANKWIKASSAHFIVYSDNNAAQTQAYLFKLEQYRYILSRFHGFTAEDDDALPKLTIYFVANHKDLEQTWPKANADVAGYFKNCTEGQAAVGIYQDDRIRKSKDARGQDENASQAILFHEYAHNFMFQNSDGQFPPWYVEGFAEYYSTTKIEGDTAVIGMAFSWRVYTLMSPGATLSYEDLLRDSWRVAKGRKETRTDEFYAQSWLLTHYLLADPDRQNKFDSYLEAYRKGDDPVAAFEKAFGFPVKNLRKTLNAYTDKLMATQYRIKDMPTPEVKVETMPVSANKLLLWDAADRLCPSRADVPALLANIRGEAAKFPGDDYAALALARAEIIIGDEWKALDYLKTYTAAHPDDANAAYMLGQTWFLMTEHKHIVDGETADSQMKQARIFLGKGYKLDPLNAGDLYYFSLAQGDPEGEPSDNAINAALEAHSLAPSVEAFAFRAVQLLIRKGRLDEAKEVLFPLANNPHNPELAKWVQAIIAAIDGHASKEDVLKAMNSSPDDTTDADGDTPPKDKPQEPAKPDPKAQPQDQSKDKA